jgi:hypothetical protein
LNGVKGYEEKEMDRMYDLKTMETVSEEVFKE